MNQPDRPKIIQIIPVTKLFLAVFRDKKWKNGIRTYEVYAIKLVEDKDGFRYEQGIVPWGVEFMNADDIADFLGYAKDLNEAFKLYGKEGQSFREWADDWIDEVKNKNKKENKSC